MARATVSIILNQVWESTLFAIKALNENKVRTFLSTLGITIGIFCIITVLTIVDSLERNVQNSVQSLGSDVVFIDKWPWEFTEDYKWWKYVNRPNPRLSELRTVDEQAAYAEASALVVSLNGSVKYESNSAEGISLMGVSQHYDQIRNFDFAQGRYFTETESNNGSHVAILGNTIAETLFPNVDAINKEITIKGSKFRVIGIAAKEGESLIGNGLDNTVLVPVKTVSAYVRINSDRANAQIQVKAAPGVSVDRLEEELHGIMRAERKLKPGQEENFALNKISLIAEPLSALFSGISIAGWVIGIFASIVGGFGIANIMFVSVKERTNQIGIQKSLGAKNYFILIEFLVESVVLCLAGGAIGLLLVFSITYLAGQGIGFDISLSTENVVTGILISVIIGVLSGFIPAFTASKLDPVVAIRSK